MDNYAVRLTGGKISALIDACQEEFSAWKYSSENRRTQILLFEGYSFWRNNSDVAVILTFDLEGKDSCRLNIVAAGGAYGVFRIDWGAESSRLNKVLRFVEEFASKNSIGMRKIAPEESGWTNLDTTYFDSANYDTAPEVKIPQLYMKFCIKCGKEIPKSSERCEFCGADQPTE